MESSSSVSSSFFYGTSLDHADLEAAFCECTVETTHPRARLCTRDGRRRAVVGSGMRRYESRFFYDAYNDSHIDYGDGRRHFLDACFLCKKPLAGNRDIFMYRGDMPFCSEECRQAQIEKDETKEKNSKYSARATSEKPEQQQQQQQQEQKQSSQRIPVSAW